MESVINFTFRRPSHHQIPLSLHHRRRSISKPVYSFSFTTSSSFLKISSFSSPINASISNSPSSIPNPRQKPPISPLKTAVITAVTAAALFISQLNLKPVLANAAVSAPPPPATVVSQSVADPETESGYEPDPKEEEKKESVPKELESTVGNPETEPGNEADPEEEKEVKEESVPKESVSVVVADSETESRYEADPKGEKEESVPMESESVVADSAMEESGYESRYEADPKGEKEESVPMESESVVADSAMEESGYEADPEEEEVEEEEEEDESDVADSETDSESDTDYVHDPELLNILEQRIASDPKDVEALQTLMHIKLLDNKPEEALVFLEKLLILEPNDKELLFLKEYIHSITGNLEASKDIYQNIFREMISKEPFGIEAYVGLITNAESEEELIEAEQKVKEGLEKAKKAKKKLSMREFNFLLAHILVLRQEYDDALRIYSDLITEKPSDFMPYMYQGIAYILMKKDVEARKSFREYQRLAPKNHPTRKHFWDNVREAKLFVKERENEKVSSRR